MFAISSDSYNCPPDHYYSLGYMVRKVCILSYILVLNKHRCLYSATILHIIKVQSSGAHTAPQSCG